MLAFKINNQAIEKTLLSKFKTQRDMSDYFCKLAEQDLDGDAFESDKQNFTQAVIKGLLDIKQGNTQSLDEVKKRFNL